MAQPAANDKTAKPVEALRVPAAQLAAFAKRAFEAAGLSAADAEIVAGLMVEADLRGSDTHGVIRLPINIKRLKAGGINPRPNIRLVQDKPASALVDGDNGIGPPGDAVATRNSRSRRPRRTGVAWVGARMSNHAGPAALYATMPLAHDMIGLYLAVGSNNHLPPWGAHGNPARHQSDRDRNSGGRRAADRARHGADRRGLRQGAAQGAARRGDAGRLDDRPRGQAAHRSQAHGRRPAAADRRVQGLRPEPDHRASGRHAQPRSVRAATSSISPRTSARRPTPATPSWRCRSNRSCRWREFKRAVDEVVRAISRSQAAAGRRAHLAAGRAEPPQAAGSPQQRHPDAQGAARQSRRRGARSQHRAAG